MRVSLILGIEWGNIFNQWMIIIFKHGREGVIAMFFKLTPD